MFDVKKYSMFKVFFVLLICSMVLVFTQAPARADNGPGKVLFTFDDGWESTYTNAFPILEAANFDATAYINSSSVRDGQAGIMTLAELHALYSSGWDISNHTSNHHEIGLFTDETHLNESRQLYLACQNWLISNGMPRGAYHAAYPSGNFTPELISVLKNIGVLTARATVSNIQNTPITSQDDYYRLPVKAVSSNYSLDACYNAIDQAVADGSTVIFMIHKVELTQGSLTTTKADFQSLVNYVQNYVNSNQAVVMTMSQWYNEQIANPLTPVVPPAPAVTNDDTADTVSGMTVIMEYSLDGAPYAAYHDATFNAISFADNHTLAVRYAASGINPHGPDTTLTFTTTKKTVSFNSNSGSHVDSILAEANTTIAEPPQPTRDGYTFAGWYQDQGLTNAWNFGTSLVTADITLHAKWTVNSYTVTFKDWDGTTITSQSVNYGEAATAPANPTRLAYTFSRWDVSFSNITGDLTVTAVYAINSFTVTFKDWDGTTITTQNVNYGGAAAAPANPIRPGYTFSHWDVGFSSITADLTVTAVYTINSYTVTFKDWDGTTITSQSVNYGGAAMAPANPARLGYTFSHWDVGYNNITADLTVTAVYTINSFTVTFKDWDGTVIIEQDVDYGSAASAPANPARLGYTFVNWDVAFSNITADLTVTAVYTINNYTVTFKDWDGTTITAQNVNYGGAATAPANPTRLGYTFSHWDVGFSSITADLTVTAVYTINSYTVTFKDWDGTTITAQSVDYGGAATAPTSPARFGYTFSKWDADYSSITADLTVTAVYAINSYTVTFKDWDGTTIAAQSVEYGGAATAPADPARLGYTFIRWDTGYGNITADLTVTAVYAINSYTVTFKDWDGTVLIEQDVDYGGAATAPTSPARFGYTFSKWDADYSSITADLTVTAVYAINSYTVTFKDWDGTTIAAQSVEYGSAATAPADPARLGYTFIKWDIGYGNITGDLTVTAVYAINSYTVTFKDWDGTTITAQSVDYGGAATAPTSPARFGYTFSKWDADYSSITADLTVTAVYAINSYTVTFEDWDGTVILEQDVDYGSAATAPASPTRLGYTFSKWDVDYSNISADLTVTAVYTINIYTVTFEDWDGTVILEQDVDYGSAATAPANPIRLGYTFSKWDVDYSNITANLTVTAVYTINSYTVTFKNWDGTTITTQSVNYGSTATAPASPTRLGYTFSKWDVDYSSITADLVVTAVYTINSYTVTFKNWDGTTITTQSVNYGSAATAPANPTRLGHTFSKWDVGFNNITTNLTVTAVFTINSYTVTFKDWEGTTLKSQSVNYGGAATAPANPTRTGYSFTKWDVGFSSITANLTVTAVYTINTYTVMFDKNGGNTEAYPATIHANYSTVITAPMAPTRMGYSFAGWYKEPECKTTWNFLTDKVVTDITLYAGWSITIPTVPTSVKAVSASYNSILVSWDAVNSASGYEIYRASTSNGTYYLAGTTAANNFTNYSLTPGTTYYYKVKSFTLAGLTKTYSGYSAFVSAKPVPAAPAAVKATPVTYNSIKVTWSAVAGITKYELYRATSQNGAYTLLATTSYTYYTNQSISTGTTYYYKVRAYRLAGSAKLYGLYSAPVSAKTALSAPGSTRATPVSYNSIKVTWAAVAGATRYELYRATSYNGVYTRLTTTGNRYYTNYSVGTGTTYYYKVRAYRLVGHTKVYSAFSTIASVRTVLAAPTSVRAARASATSIRVSWRAVTGASGYEIWRAESSGGAYTRLTATTGASYTNAGLTTGRYYYYKVVAYRLVSGIKVYSGFSAMVYTRP